MPISNYRKHILVNAINMGGFVATKRQHGIYLFPPEDEAEPIKMTKEEFNFLLAKSNGKEEIMKLPDNSVVYKFNDELQDDTVEITTLYDGSVIDRQLCGTPIENAYYYDERTGSAVDAVDVFGFVSN